MLGTAEEFQCHGKVEGHSLIGERFLFKRIGGIEGTSKATVDVKSKGLWFIRGFPLFTWISPGEGDGCPPQYSCPRKLPRKFPFFPPLATISSFKHLSHSWNAEAMRTIIIF